jgi:ribosomal protein S18 acetylase RimI-like enzyme
MNQPDKTGPPLREDMPIDQGYRPGVIGQVVTLHAETYSDYAGFGRSFEGKVAAELSAFVSRLDHGGNGLWHASSDGAILGSIAIDGEDLGDGRAHLRWFIVAPAARGVGLGQKLLRTALDFVDAHGFRETQLWTLKGLETARALYERAGFKLQSEYEGDQWGKLLVEQTFVRKRQMLG